MDEVVKEIQTETLAMVDRFYYDAEDAVRIRTGEHGGDALCTYQY